MGEHLKRRHFAMFAAAAAGGWCPEEAQMPMGRLGHDLGPTGFSRDISHPTGMSSEDRQRLQDGVRRQNQRSDERAGQPT